MIKTITQDCSLYLLNRNREYLISQAEKRKAALYSLGILFLLSISLVIWILS